MKDKMLQSAIAAFLSRKNTKNTSSTQINFLTIRSAKNE